MPTRKLIIAVCGSLSLFLAGGPLEAAGAKPPTAPAPALTPAEQATLLEKRLQGGTSMPFKEFSNMFLVRSNLDLGTAIALATADQKIAKTELMPAFPQSYQPTLREFLDLIGLQTGAAWKYDPSGKFVKNEAGKPGKPGELAVFEFTPVKRKKPYTVTLPKGWKSTDRGSWTMCVPPTFPVGLDIYEAGSYSTDAPAEDEELRKRIPKDVSLDWAARVKPTAAESDLKPARVGEFDALFFESSTPSQLGGEVHWRQWVFMSGPKCYFIVSTIPPDHEADVFPGVEAILKSFAIPGPEKNGPAEEKR